MIASSAVERLVSRTAALIDIPSVSFEEAAIVDHLADVLASTALVVDRVGDNLVARTMLGRPQRLVLAGHTDTVPANGNEVSKVEDGVVWGLGAADMKAGLAAMVELALSVTDPAVDLTFVFYAREEVAAAHSGLEELFRVRPELLAGDAAILGEPTAAAVEAGCQGTLRARVTLRGQRAHTARPWMGRNAIHRLEPVLAALNGATRRQPTIEGLEFREAIEAVFVEGGVAGNVVPDEVTLVVNHRFAPDRDVEAAFDAVRTALAPALEEADSIELVEWSPAAPPGIDHPLLDRLVHLASGVVKPKLGWTDVARFASRGIPAVNFGPGDSTLAHRADERVEATSLTAVFSALEHLVTAGG